MSSAISSVRHSFNESLKILSLVCCFTLMMCSGHYCLSLYPVPGHCWPQAKNWSPTLSSSHHPGEPSVPLQHHGLQTPSNTASFLWKTLGQHYRSLWQRSPAIQIPAVGIIWNHTAACKVTAELPIPLAASWVVSTERATQACPGVPELPWLFPGGFSPPGCLDLCPGAVLLHTGWWFPRPRCRMRRR